MKGSKNRSVVAGRSAKRGSPGLDRPGSRAGRWRARQVRLPLSFSSKLLVSFRRFRTSPARRSARYWQRVYRFNAFSLREIAIAKVPKQSWRKYAKPAQAKRPNGAIRWALPILLAVAVNTGFYYHSTISNNGSRHISVHKAVASADPQPQLPKSMPRSVPERLIIPSIQVNSELMPLGRYADGTMEMPPIDSSSVPGWYEYGPTPGEIGPAVIAGHVDTWTGPAVFWRVHELKPGDEIDVIRQDGTTAKFAVTSVEQSPRDSFPTQRVYGKINYAGIRIITCGGQFNETTHEYQDNIIAFGVLQ